MPGRERHKNFRPVLEAAVVDSGLACGGEQGGAEEELVREFRKNHLIPGLRSPRIGDPDLPRLLQVTQGVPVHGIHLDLV